MIVVQVVENAFREEKNGYAFSLSLFPFFMNLICQQ